MRDTYLQFKENIITRFREMCEPEAKVTVQHVVKNNSVTYDGLTVETPNSNISPTIYLNYYYDDYKKHGDFERTFQEIADVYKKNRPDYSMNVDFFLKFDNMRPYIAYKLINYEQNQELLEKIPHARYLDLAIVFYCLLQSGKRGNATILIQHSHLKIWEVTEQELYHTAIENTPCILKSEILRMYDIISDMVAEAKEHDPELFERDRSHEMYVLTNEARLNGASCLLYKGLLQEFSNRIKQDLYVLPSSIHEVILVPADLGFSRSEFDEMVREVNRTQVAKEEVLSDHAYYYSYKEQKLMM